MNTEILNAIAAELPGFQCPQHWDAVTVAALVGSLFEQHYTSWERVYERDAGGGFEDAIASDKVIHAHTRRRVQPAVRQLRAAEKIAKRVLKPRRAACVAISLRNAEEVLLRATEGEYRDRSAFHRGLSKENLNPPRRVNGRPRQDDYDLNVSVWQVLQAAGWKRAPAAKHIALLHGEPKRAGSIEVQLYDYDQHRKLRNPAH